VTASLCAAAIAATAVYWSKAVDVSFLMNDPHVAHGQLWRLFTSTLLHADFLHLLFNLFWTWTFGTLVERVYGPVVTAAILLTLAVSSSAFEYALFDGGIGLSGVGYGLFGLLWVLSHQPGEFEGAIDPRTTAMFAIWFVFCIATTLNGTLPVANVAHGAGWLVGMVVGAAMATRGTRRLVFVGGVAVVLAASVAAATVARPLVNASRRAGDEEARLGFDALTADRNAEAVVWYTDATRLAPGEAGNWYNMGIAHDRLGHKAESIAAFDRAAKLNPSDADYAAAAGAAEASTRPTAGGSSLNWRSALRRLLGN
jgi:membrane associated rhomboid family serine protease